MSNPTLTRSRLHQLLKQFKEEHAGEYHLLRLGYFGSHARGEAGTNSDIDIVFDTDHPNLYTTVILKQDLEELLGQSVDLLQIRGLTNKRLKARIEEDVVYV